MDTAVLSRLALALAIGLLAGLERGWQKRGQAEGSRVAGLRTFGLIGLLGGLWALLASAAGEWMLVAAFAALAVLIAAGYAASAAKRGDLGMTTEVAALATFALGALAVRGYGKEAAAGAVVMTALLSFKPVLHRWVERLGRPELYAAIQLLLISVVVLPNLPDRGYGPWEALNPYHLWWMVVLIAAISYAGYIAVRLLGAKAGLAATSLLGGLVSSTAVTLAFSRLGRRQPKAWRLYAAGIVLASAVMFPRVLLEAGVVNAALVPLLLGPVAAAALAAFAGAALYLRRADAAPTGEGPSLRNPVELASALLFGAGLAAVTLALVALRQRLGAEGVYLASAAAGLMDVDAVTLSLARLSREGLDPAVACRGILIAAAVNSASKAALAAALAGGRLGLACAGTLGAAIAAGAAVLALQGLSR